MIDPLGDPEGLVGTLIDERYVVLSVLGEGAMGRVYRAWQRAFSREVALKVVDLAGADPVDRVELGARFLREVALLARLDSPHVARILDSAVLPDGNLYYAMERVAGQSLDRVMLVEGRLAPAKVLSLAQSLAAALAAVHRAGLVHRDVKPANLILTRLAEGGEALKLVDFGIARPFDEPKLQALTSEFAILGSFPYMAPEQLAGGRHRPGVLGPAIDVYAAGCTLFELVVGHPPYPGPTAPAFVQQHLTSPIPRLGAFLDPDPTVAQLDEVIAACLAKNANDRPPDGQALAALLAPRAAVTSRRTSDLAFGLPEDPGTVRGVRADDVLSRTAQRPARTSPVTAGRVAMGLALFAGLADVVLAIVQR